MLRFKRATLVGGPLVCGVVEEWEWSRRGGSYGKGGDFFAVHWEVQERDPNAVRLHVESPRSTDDPTLNRIKAEIVNRLLEPDVLGAVRATGFLVQRGRKISSANIEGNKSTEPFRIALTSGQQKPTIEQCIELVHRTLHELIQQILTPFIPRLDSAFRAG